MRLVCGLGNPGAEYASTRHNVGWWALDYLQVEWRFGPFRRSGAGAASHGIRAGEDVVLLKPLTYMNRSGAALRPYLALEDFSASRDMMVVVDDTALPAGRIRCRARGSAGGHNGLKSVEATLRTQEYPRLRLGVDGAPPGVDLADWVLSPFDRQTEEEVISVLPLVADALDCWIREGIEAAAACCSRGPS